jgi:hypothetical protein
MLVVRAARHSGADAVKPETRAAKRGLTARIRHYLADVPEGYALTGRTVAEVFNVSHAMAGMTLWQMAKAGDLTRSVPLGTYRKPVTTGRHADDYGAGLAEERRQKKEPV